MEKFEFVIEVYDKDLADNGEVRLKPKGIQTVTANSKQELINLYQACDQHIKIISEKRLPQKQIQSQSQSTQALNCQKNDLEKQDINKIRNQLANTSEKNIENERRINIYANSSKPNYYKIGDVEIKEFNGKIYQKQWIRLNSKEAENLRIVNTNTNKLVSMVGKHIEIKRWILIDNVKDSDDSEIIIERD